MNATKVFFAGVLGVLLGLGQLPAQTPQEPIEVPPAALPGYGAGTAPNATNGAASGDNLNPSQPFHTLSNWITYKRDNCCEAPTGPNLPIGTEFFARVGPSVPFGQSPFGTALDVGWMFDGGVRGLWWDQSLDRAWTVQASISNHVNRAGINDITVPLNTFLPSTTIVNGTPAIKTYSINPTIKGLNRTFVNLGLGREWYLWTIAEKPGLNWRYGLDGGFRYGTAKADFYPFAVPKASDPAFPTTATTIRHRTDVIGGAFAALHTDLEVQCGCCILQYGLRCEWAYTWSDILQGQSDLQDLNLLVNLGVRY